MMGKSRYIVKEGGITSEWFAYSIDSLKKKQLSEWEVHGLQIKKVGAFDSQAIFRDFEE